VGTLVKPENKATLTGILTYHVVSGRLDSKELAERIRAGNGTAEIGHKILVINTYPQAGVFTEATF
jgi:uncharacterized surface protein with fasciclin (FAS1) repeats